MIIFGQVVWSSSSPAFSRYNFNERQRSACLQPLFRLSEAELIPPLCRWSTSRFCSAGVAARHFFKLVSLFARNDDFLNRIQFKVQSLIKIVLSSRTAFSNPSATSRETLDRIARVLQQIRRCFVNQTIDVFRIIYRPNLARRKLFSQNFEVSAANLLYCQHRL